MILDPLIMIGSLPTTGMDSTTLDSYIFYYDCYHEASNCSRNFKDSLERRRKI